MAMEGEFTLGGEHIMQHTDMYYRIVTWKLYINILNSVIPVNLIKKMQIVFGIATFIFLKCA